jgi:hypothetical protein
MNNCWYLIDDYSSLWIFHVISLHLHGNTKISAMSFMLLPRKQRHRQVNCLGWSQLSRYSSYSLRLALWFQRMFLASTLPCFGRVWCSNTKTLFEIWQHRDKLRLSYIWFHFGFFFFLVVLEFEPRAYLKPLHQPSSCDGFLQNRVLGTDFKPWFSWSLPPE